MNTVGSDGNLAQGFKPRHVTMLSIAGIIGAGLFVGSGHAIAAAGPRKSRAMTRFSWEPIGALLPGVQAFQLPELPH